MMQIINISDLRQGIATNMMQSIAAICQFVVRILAYLLASEISAPHTDHGSVSSS